MKMVNSEEVLKNGKKGSRPASPVHLAASSNGGQGSESSEDEREGRIRVGREYQAVPPPFIAKCDRRADQCPERALLVWSPSQNISNKRLEEFIQVAKDKYSYNAEQALGMLFWHKHDLDRALQDLSNFTPFPDEWSVEDKVLFEQAFQFHGKSFHRIRQMLPDKSIAALVKYYYSWKKTRTRTSLMDRQAKKLQSVREDGRLGEESFVEGEEADKEDAEKVKCVNCGICCHHAQSTPKGNMCGTCHGFYTRTGQVRPTTGPLRKDGMKLNRSLFRNSTKPPKGMHINHDDLVALATGPGGQGESLLKALDREVLQYKRTVQNNKQILSTLRRKTRGCDIVPYRVPEASASRINARWSNDEHLLAVQGIRNFGKDFKTIAEILGTKTEVHVRSFFANMKRRFNLDAVLQEYEEEFGPQGETEVKVKTEVDKDADDSHSNTATNTATPQATAGNGGGVTATPTTAGGGATKSSGSLLNTNLPRSKSPAVKVNGSAGSNGK